MIQVKGLTAESDKSYPYCRQRLTDTTSSWGDTVPALEVDTCLRTVITGEGAPNTRAGLILKSMVMPDTRTCDACGRRYTFTSYKDRCPFCCPKQDDKTDDYELDDWGSGDDLTPESE